MTTEPVAPPVPRASTSPPDADALPRKRARSALRWVGLVILVGCALVGLLVLLSSMPLLVGPR